MSKAPVAVILAAGVGSRLRPLTDDRPKALVEVGRETILGRATRLLLAHGVRELVVATGYRHDAVERALAGTPVPVHYRLNPEYATTQNSVSLALCADVVRGRAFYKLDGDVVFRGEVLERLDAVPAHLVAAVDRRRALDAEAMKVEAEGSAVLSFSKELDLRRSVGESIGIERLDEEASEAVFGALEATISAGRRDLYYEAAYTDVIRSGLRAGFADVSDLPWSEIDTAEDLAAAQAMLRDT
jgi:choline kinase